MAAWDKDLDQASAPAWQKDLDRQQFGELKTIDQRGAKELVRDTFAGGVRGAGSIGSTLLSGINPAEDIARSSPHAAKLLRDSGVLMSREERGAAMDNALASLGADTNSLPFKGGKLGAEIAGTAGTGNVLARGASAIPWVAERFPALVNALRSGGLTTGPSASGFVGNALARTAGGAATGAASAGLVNPDDAGKGGFIGAVVPNALRFGGFMSKVAGGLARGVVEPWTEAGREAIAGRVLSRFGVSPQDVAGLSTAPTATGARLSLAEQIASPEGAAAAARLQRSLGAVEPTIGANLLAREVENNAARVNKLRDLAGVDGGRAFAEAERAGTAGPMYRDAFANGSALTPAQLKAQADLLKSGQIEKLMQSPAIQDAMAAARKNMENAGRSTADPAGSIEGMHQMKLALDDMISKAEAKSTGAAANTAAGLRAAQRRLVDVIETLSPEYKNARSVYAQMSKPINQMDVAGELLARGTANTGDLATQGSANSGFMAGNQRLMPNALLGALKNEGALIKNATGRDLGDSLNALMTPEQLRTIKGVANEVDRSAAVARAANGPGSATAQGMASANLLQRIGLSGAAAEHPVVESLMRIPQLIAKVPERRIQELLGEIVLNPAMAERVMQKATPAQRAQLQKLISSASSGAVRLAPPIVADQ